MQDVGSRVGARNHRMASSTRSLFTSHGLRCTTQRQSVYEALCATESHPTAEELFASLADHGDPVSLATVYNTLEIMAVATLVRKMPTAGGGCRWDARTSAHLHLRCPDTDRISDVPDALGQPLLDRLSAEAVRPIEEALGVSIEQVEIQLVARPTPS